MNRLGRDRVKGIFADGGEQLVRRETGEEESVKVRYDEGVATHIDPEPCIVVREGRGEASAGAHTGQPLSRESHSSRVPTLLIEWKATRSSSLSQVVDRPGVVEDPGTHACSLNGNREISRLAEPPRTASVRIGKARSRSR